MCLFLEFYGKELHEQEVDENDCVCVCVILHKQGDDIFSLERLSPSIHPPNHPFDHSTFYTPFLIHRTHCNTWFTLLILLWTISPIPPLANPATLFHYLPALLILPTLCSFPLPRFSYPLYDQALRVHFLPKKKFCCPTRRYPLINSISSLTLFSHHLFHLLILKLRTLLCHYSSVIIIWTIPLLVLTFIPLLLSISDGFKYIPIYISLL